MLANLLSSLIVCCGVGLSSINHDHNSTPSNDINNSIIKKADDSYSLNGVYQLPQGVSSVFYNGSSFVESASYIDITFTFKPLYDGFIIGDKNGGDGNDLFSFNVNYYLGFKINLKQQSSSNPNILVSFEVLNPSTTEYENINDITNEVNKYYAFGNCELSSTYVDSSIEGLNKDIIFNWIDTNYYKYSLTEENGSENNAFERIYSNYGSYTFRSNYNPSFMLFDNQSSSMEFGAPYYLGDWDKYNYFTSDESSSWFEVSDDERTLNSVDLFEGLFTYGGTLYTSIVSYYVCFSWRFANTYNSFVRYAYTTFENAKTNQKLLVHNSFTYKKAPNTNINYGFEPSVSYDIYASVDSNYDYTLKNTSGVIVGAFNQYFCNARFENQIPTIQIIYTCNRPLNDYGFRSGATYNQVLNFSSSSNNGNTSTEGNLNNVFYLVGLGFGGLTGLFAMQILPGLTLGTLIFIPLVFTIVLFIVKLFKR